jgi:uncharacterized protein
MPTPAFLRRRGAAARLLLWAGVAVLLASCSPHRELYPRLERLSAEGRYEDAAKLVEKNKSEYGDRNAVLYNLDRGTLYHYAGDYKKSNEAFAEAERRMDELYTESVTGNVGAFVVNDNTLPYPGEDFEKVTVNLYRALNYIELGQVDEAIVEARKINLKLEKINDAYPADKKNVYKEDAFARLLAGVLYEMGGTRDDLNDAYISDRLAANAYAKDFAKHYNVQAPEVLAHNLLTTAIFMGSDELAAAKKTFPDVEAIPYARVEQQAQLYFVHFAGRGPTKVEGDIRAIMPDGNFIKIAFPRYRSNYYLINGSQVLVDGQPGVTLQEAQPLGAIAVENLDNRKTRIAVKAIARATTKYLASRALQHEARRKSEAAGLLAYVAGNAYAEFSEKADLRSWQTLPDRVLIGRVMVPPGKHHLVVAFTSGPGNVVFKRDLGDVDVHAGETRFFIVHTLK